MNPSVGRWISASARGRGLVPAGASVARLGFRTSHEIKQERQGLKALRGDFDAISRSEDSARAAIEALRVIAIGDPASV